MPIRKEKKRKCPDASTYTPGMAMDHAEDHDPDAELIPDEETYVMRHDLLTGAPCLSFDFIKDNLGENRIDFPMTCFAVSGTQAAPGKSNNLIVMKMHNLHKTNKVSDDSDSEEDSDDEDEDKKPILDTVLLNHSGAVNRVRSTYFKDRCLCATWSDSGFLHMWDLSDALKAVESPAFMETYRSHEGNVLPIGTFPAVSPITEGFAMDWSLLHEGLLAVGNCNSRIYALQIRDDGSLVGDVNKHYSGHTASVEEVQWKPDEPGVLASCSVDKSIRIWNMNASPTHANVLTIPEAHSQDINVMHWNRSTTSLLLTGGDDSFIKVWDLRYISGSDPSPVAYFKFHTAPITSVSWCPQEDSVFAASGEDNKVTIWDLAMEREGDLDPIEESADIPPQLLFCHQGQTDIKEIHWHPQLRGVLMSTALSDMNIFKTINAVSPL